jgi:hypothetical protein
MGEHSPNFLVNVLITYFSNFLPISAIFADFFADFRRKKWRFFLKNQLRFDPIFA